ncbi:MAG: dynamin family protein [Pseudomonadota bacterium]
MQLKNHSLHVIENLAHRIELAEEQLKALDDGEYNLIYTTRALQSLQKRIMRPLRIAILGELNSGKSSLANLLIRNIKLPTRAITNTRLPTLIFYSEKPTIHVISHDGTKIDVDVGLQGDLSDVFRLEIGLPEKSLKHREILDCPGLSAIEMDDSDFNVSEHSVDGVLWCTIATAAWRENEMSAWFELSERTRVRSILVITHKDQLSDDQLERVLGRLQNEIGVFFKDIIGLSSRQAIAAFDQQQDYTDAADGLWTKSGAAEFMMTFDALCENIRLERAESALRVVQRIANRTLVRMDLNT